MFVVPDRLHYDVHEGVGEPMLLVHGIMGGRGLWSANIDALREVCSPIVVELYGHGRSPSPGEVARYQPEAYVEEFERIRTELGVDRWWLTGQSLGAALTLRYCLDHPGRALGHVFTNSASGLGDATWVAELTARAEGDARRMERAGWGALHDLRINPARSHRIVESVRDALTADEPLLDPNGIANGIRSTAIGASVRDRIAENTVPSLLVVGTRERGFADCARFASTQMPHLRVEAFDVGHSPNAEVPDEFNRVVAEFVLRPVV